MTDNERTAYWLQLTDDVKKLIYEFHSELMDEIPNIKDDVKRISFIAGIAAIEHLFGRDNILSFINDVCKKS